MSERRFGRSFKIKELDTVRSLIMQPILPHGWVIIQNGRLSHQGMVFTKKGAEELVEALKKNVEENATARGYDKYWFFETTGASPFDLHAIKPPEGTQLHQIPDKDDETSTGVVSEEHLPHMFMYSSMQPAYCMICEHLRNHPLHWYEKESDKKMHMLPAHYSTPTERIAQVKEQQVIVETKVEAEEVTVSGTEQTGPD